MIYAILNEFKLNKYIREIEEIIFLFTELQQFDFKKIIRIEIIIMNLMLKTFLHKANIYNYERQKAAMCCF